MKVVGTRYNKDGSATLSIRLRPDESALVRNGVAQSVRKGATAVFINPEYHYRLGGQVGDVVAPHVITDAAPMYWSSIEQKWAEA